MNKRSNNSKSILAVVLILVLLGLSAYLWMVNSNLKSDLNEVKTSFHELEKLNTELNQDYEDALKDLEDMRSDNQELNALIDAQKAELTTQKARISGLIWTERELGKVRAELDKFKGLAEEYVADITHLQEKNAELTEANKELIERNTNLTEEVTANRAQITVLDSTTNVLSAQAEKLSEENEELNTKVDIAAAIRLNSIEAVGILIKDNGKLKERKRAKKVDLLRTCFTTEKNLVAEAGEKQFFLKYIGPSGEILYVEELGSGMIKDLKTQEKIKYTASGTINYNNTNMNACLDWKPNFDLQKGLYKVEIYNNGLIVGKSEFKLR